MQLDYLPLKTYTNIVEGNALRLDWETVVSKNKVSYIMGNPPFVGASNMNHEQKSDAVAIFGKIKLSNSIDYVGAWYHKAVQYIHGTQIHISFVSTNSITQGEQVAPLWGKLFEDYGVRIDFAYRTFKWGSEAKEKAAVHCVIIGFSIDNNTDGVRFIYDGTIKTAAQNINAYLVDAPNVLIASRSKPICDVPPMVYGNKPTDDGNLILSIAERNELLAREPESTQFIRRYVGAAEFINNGERYCIWLKDVPFTALKHCPTIQDRVRKVREFRLASTAKPTVEKAETPHLFFFISHTGNEYLLVPRHSSENRQS
jgi:hypothetical protein